MALHHFARPFAVMLCGLMTLAHAPAAHAQTTEGSAANTVLQEGSLTALADALQLDALFGVLRDEGLAYGATLEADMFPGSGGPFWTEAVSAIYDTKTMRLRFDTALAAELAGDSAAVSEAVAFFSSDLGQRVVGLEIEARRAFLDTPTEEAARVAADDRTGNRDPLVKQLRRFIAAGDLLEMNVAAALSTNLAFVTGMSESGVFGEGLPQDELVSDVWAKEEALRDSSSLWLYAFLGMAYEPLPEADVEA